MDEGEYERVLNRVRRIVGIAAVGAGDDVQRRIVPGRDLLESSRLARLRTPHQIGITLTV